MLEEMLREMIREANDELGVWAGGISTSTDHICKVTGAFYTPTSLDTGFFQLDNETAKVCRVYHWGVNSGDWWWVLA